MKVLFISPWYPNRTDPMFGLFVRKHAEAVRLYSEVAVLHVTPDKNIKHIEISESNKNLYEVIIYFPAPKIILFNLLYFLIAYFKGFRLIHKNWGKPDIIQANIFTRTAVISYIYHLFYKTPYVVIEHWTRYFREITFRNYLHKIISQWVAHKAAAVMPVTHHLQQWMEKHGMTNNKYIVVNNVVDDDFYQDYPKSTISKKSILNVTCFDDDQKNLSGIVNVIKKLHKIRKDFIIYLVGDGVDFEKIRNLAHQNNMENDPIVFTGMLEGEKLVKKFRECDFSILFSNYENIPVVISESLFCGKPVISTNVGGINEHINSSNGMLINKGNEQELLDAIIYMLDRYKEFNSENIAKEAIEKYSYQSIGKHLYNIYNDIIKEQSKKSAQ